MRTPCTLPLDPPLCKDDTLNMTHVAHWRIVQFAWSSAAPYNSHIMYSLHIMREKEHLGNVRSVDRATSSNFFKTKSRLYQTIISNRLVTFGQCCHRTITAFCYFLTYSWVPNHLNAEIKSGPTGPGRVQLTTITLVKASFSSVKNLCRRFQIPRRVKRKIKEVNNNNIKI